MGPTSKCLPTGFSVWLLGVYQSLMILYMKKCKYEDLLRVSASRSIQIFNWSINVRGWVKEYNATPTVAFIFGINIRHLGVADFLIIQMKKLCSFSKAASAEEEKWMQNLPAMCKEHSRVKPCKRMKVINVDACCCTIMIICSKTDVTCFHLGNFIENFIAWRVHEFHAKFVRKTDITRIAISVFHVKLNVAFTCQAMNFSWIA